MLKKTSISLMLFISLPIFASELPTGRRLLWLQYPGGLELATQSLENSEWAKRLKIKNDEEDEFSELWEKKYSEKVARLCIRKEEMDARLDIEKEEEQLRRVVAWLVDMSCYPPSSIEKDDLAAEN